MITNEEDQRDQGTLKGKRSNIMRHKDVYKYCKKGLNKLETFLPQSLPQCEFSKEIAGAKDK